ncbi:MAG TPA: orotate phosphoribosyltransferase [Bacillus sp. (in: firmicutes)]|uniref:orotate phosphoribosyltransferase n=1 Tax=Bacillus litorisediminis TaxID=2922713 RepID=UPI001FAB6C28|nr:orotate phosphoribosyltransferase [Bacillus litorisediminis]HWO77892.1 orotate phosphoribosyltransferase [Bacillus sp. (in: firmicutes)]
MSYEVAKKLLEIGAVELRPNQPFTLSSGLLSPIYCDNRLTLSFPSVRKLIAQQLANKINEKFPEATHISGTATAGIPHAALVSEQLNLPMSYIRGESKGHGRKNLIEGLIKEEDKVVVIEDLISTGKSVIKAVHALRDNGIDVLGTVSIFTYELQKGIDQLQEHDILNFSICTFPELIEAALEVNAISEEDAETLRNWQQDPENWKL